LAVFVVPQRTAADPAGRFRTHRVVGEAELPRLNWLSDGADAEVR
jgi:hypothetical protein